MIDCVVLSCLFPEKQKRLNLRVAGSKVNQYYDLRWLIQERCLSKGKAMSRPRTVKLRNTKAMLIKFVTNKDLVLMMSQQPW